MSLLIWRGAISTGTMVPRELNGGHFYVGVQGTETVVLWQDRDLNYACVAQAAPEALLDLAARVWRNDVN